MNRRELFRMNNHYASIRTSVGPKSLLLALILILFSQSGCQIFSRFNRNKVTAPVVYSQLPTKQVLIANLNEQAKKVNQLKTNVRVSMPGLPVLKGTLVLERPRRLRLKAGLLGIHEMGVDLGSNDDYFWIWTKASLPGESPALMYASHRAFQNSPLRNSIPLDPTWILDALGFTEFKSTDHHEGPFVRPDGRWEVHTYQQTAAGQMIRVSVVDPEYGWINQQAIYDADNRRVAYVNSVKYRYYEDVDTSLPERVEIHVFPDGEQPLELVVDADPYAVNAIYGDPAKLWKMPDPQDIPRIDLTQVSAAVPPTKQQTATNPDRNN